MNLISKVWRKLHNKEYRDGYTEAQLSIEVPFQIRALRKARGWTQAQLAERCGIPQARISHIEQPGRDPLSLRTLYRLSSAFDVGLLVQFVPFSELVRCEAAFDPETFYVPSFKEDRLKTVVRTAPTSTTFRTESTFTYGRWQRRATRPQSEGKIQPQMSLPLLEKMKRELNIKMLSVDAELKSPFSIPPDYNERTQYGYETQATG